jgi:hypothetical protein
MTRSTDTDRRARACGVLGGQSCRAARLAADDDHVCTCAMLVTSAPGALLEDRRADH